MSGREYIHPALRKGYAAAVAEEARSHDYVIDVGELGSVPLGSTQVPGARDLQAELKQFVRDIAAEEPASGWDNARDLPPLEPDAVQLVLAGRPVDVSDNCAIDVALLAPLLVQSGHTADTAIAAHLRSAIEHACREAIWPAVREVIENKNELAWERQQERYYGGSGLQTLEEQYRAAAQLKWELHR